MDFLGTATPLTVYEKNDLKVVIHFGKDNPRPDVLVMVLTTLSTNSEPVKNFMFQAAVPKVIVYPMIFYLQKNLPTDLRN